MNFLDFKRLIRPIKNKIFLMLGRAVLMAVNNSEGRKTIQVIALADETISDIEWFQDYGFDSYPPVGAEVVVGFLNGNRDHGIAIGVPDGRYRPTDLVEGESALYHKEGHRVLLKAGGIIEIEGTEIKIGDPSGTVYKLLNKLAMDIYNAHTHNETGAVTTVPNTLMVENTDTTEKTGAN